MFEEILDTEVFNDNNPSALCPLLDMFLKNAEVFEKNNVHGDYKLMYRGHSNANFAICPSVFRKNNLQKEALMVNELKRIAPHEFSTCSSQFECLIKMQHYGLPTRLLDVTFNPLVALYFACADVDNLNQYGMLHAFIDRPHSYDDPLIERNALLSTYSGSSPKDLIDHFKLPPDLFNSDDRSNRETLKKLFGNREYHIVAPPLNNERIRRQQGGFLLFGLNVEKQKNPFQKEVFNPGSPPSKIESMVHGIGVPPFAKKRLLKELDAIGINDAFLFPELEHQTAYVKQQFLSIFEKTKEKP